MLAKIYGLYEVVFVVSVIHDVQIWHERRLLITKEIMSNGFTFKTPIKEEGKTGRRG